MNSLGDKELPYSTLDYAFTPEAYPQYREDMARSIGQRVLSGADLAEPADFRALIGHLDSRTGHSRPYLALAYPIPSSKTTDLYEAWWQQAEGLVLTDHMALAKDRQSPPKSLAEFGFAPVLPPDQSYLPHSLSSISHDLVTSAGVSFEYNERTNGEPFMDGRLGLGLTFRNRLVALCSGGIAKEGPMVLQLQDVSNKIPPDTDNPKVLRKFPFSNGLRSGIDWKTTLLNGWCGLTNRVLAETLPETAGMRMWVQSAENNCWVNRHEYTADGALTGRYIVNNERLSRLAGTYNKTASDVGGTFDPSTHNYILPARFSVGRAA